jgi:hypothetical protein
MLKHEAIYQKICQLDDSHLQEVSDFIDFIQNKIQHTDNQADNQETVSEQGNIFQPSIALQCSGLMGCAEGQPDLAENYKEYLAHYWQDKPHILF